MIRKEKILERKFWQFGDLKKHGVNYVIKLDKCSVSAGGYEQGVENNNYYRPFPQCQKIKMVALVWGLCMEGLWRGWRFTVIGMKKLQDIFG